jgi:hypothetical protein
MKQVRLAEDTEVGREEPPHVLLAKEKGATCAP